MTTIERSRFVADLSTRQISSREMAASLADTGMGAVEIDALAGDDHIFNRPEEYGRLFDHLLSLEREERAEGQSGNLDRALAVYNRFVSTAPITPPADPSARPRSTGIAAWSPPELAPMTRAEYVRAFGRMHAAQLRAGAEPGRDPMTGPEAGAQRRILALAELNARQVEEMESKLAGLPANDPRRTRLEAQLDADVRLFEGSVAAERSFVAMQQRSRQAVLPPGSEMLRALPPYLRETVARQGLLVPGVPIAVQPSISPPGGKLSLELKF